MSPQYQPPSVETSPETGGPGSGRELDTMIDPFSGVTEHPPSSASISDTKTQDPTAPRHTANAILPAQAPRRQSRIAPVRRTASVPAGDPAFSLAKSPDRPFSSSMSTSNEAALPTKPLDPARRPPSPSMSAVTNLTAVTTKTDGSGSSSGSGSTVTQVSASSRRNSDRDREMYKQRNRPRDRQSGHSPEVHQRPDVMSYLQPESPSSTRQPIQQASGDMPPWRLADIPMRGSPARSIASSGAASAHSDVFSDPGHGHETDGTHSSPDRSANEDWSKIMMSSNGGTPTASSYQQHQQPAFWNTGPGMPFAHPNQLPQGPPSFIQPQYVPASYEHMQHGRPEQTPMTGYELLATNLSSNSMGGPVIKPIYRRFEFLNHRLLLHLQDELAELEEQLRQLDAADTQSRQLPPQMVLPASRRQEAASSKELQWWWKMDLLGKIGFKLELYNKTLVSFRESQNLNPPAPADINRYREFLGSCHPIDEPETRFLDAEDDLVSLARSSNPGHAPDFSSDDLLTPMPHTMVFPPTPKSPMDDLDNCRSSRATYTQDVRLAPSMPQLFAAVSAAFLLPIMCFIVIPGYVGRMAVVMIVAGGLFAALLQAGVLRMGTHGLVGLGGTQDCVLCVGVYGAVMAVVAGIL